MRCPAFLCLAGSILNLSVLGRTAHAEEARNKPETIVVTGTREGKDKLKVPESVEVLTSKDVENVSPSHPAEILNRVPGVHISRLAGEGHMTAIRQPITTGGVYLYLEDGIPTRPSGFFNHNGLYEVDIPQSDRIEVIKGPSSALYGSEAIGGTINYLTKASPSSPEVSTDLELGSFGWSRGLLSAGSNIGENHGFRLDLNLTRNEGYRDNSKYGRGSSVLRFDGNLGNGLRYKVSATYTKVDQGDVSDLNEADFRDHPTKNLFQGDIAFRKVEALRISSEFAKEIGSNHLLTLTPFFRDNTMSIMPSWMLTYDPVVYTTAFQSFGFLAKYRTLLPEAGLELIMGVDVDHTPSTFKEDQITVVRDGDFFADYSKTGRVNYDFTATQNSVSPYLHSEWQAADALLLSAGVRIDHFEVKYDDKLNEDSPEAVGQRTWLRPDDTTLNFDHTSPKLGAVYQLPSNQNIYANYRHAFRAPSVGQLFRSGTSTNTEDLKSVKADSFEIGYRARVWDNMDLELSVYQMMIKDDVVSFIDGNDRKVINAGETEHSGIELGLQKRITESFGFRTAWTFSRQEYKDYEYVYSCFPPRCTPPINETRNFAGYKVGKAPESLGNFAIEYVPQSLKDLRLETEWEHVGKYYTDETNTNKYGGHDLFNVRAAYILPNGMQVYGRVLNVGDRLYSTYTSNQVGVSEIAYRPGLPRSYFLGFRASLL